MSKKELRYFVAQELRATGTDKQPRIEGYAATFGTRANIGSFFEVIQSGAFTRTLASDAEIVCLFNHDDNMLLGRRSAGTLSLKQDDKGLFFSCTLPDTSVARDVYANLRAGNLKECSFGFFVEDPSGERWDKLPDGTMLRTLLDVTLFDVSVVVSPAYGGTSASARKNVVADGVEERMKSFRDSNSQSRGNVVPFVNLGKSKRSEDPFDSVDEANGIINWADEVDGRSANQRVKNKLKAAQGFAYVANDGTKRSDYLFPHHQVRNGELVHSQIGALRAMADFKTGTVDVPEEHLIPVQHHLAQEIAYWFNNSDNSDEFDEEMELNRSRVRLAVAKLAL